MLKIGIVNYNTTVLTNACVSSIFKHVPCDKKIYIFDNSDREKYKDDRSDIVIFDNTNGKYINFSDFLFPYRKNETVNDFASAKHCVSVQILSELIDDNFILMDSDVLVKKDISALCDDTYMYVGHAMKQDGVDVIRLLPFLCFINVNMMKEKNVRYFDRSRMLCLSPRYKFDTGASFYYDASKYPHKDVDIFEYIEHLKGASWENFKHKSRKTAITQREWLEKNKSLYDAS